MDTVALLPVKYRKMILSYVPALDLHELEGTTIVDGVDTGKLWEALYSHFIALVQVPTNSRDYKSLFLKFTLDVFFGRKTNMLSEALIDCAKCCYGKPYYHNNFLRMLLMPAMKLQTRASNQAKSSGLHSLCNHHNLFIPKRLKPSLPSVDAPYIEVCFETAFLLANKFKCYETVSAFGCGTQIQRRQWDMQKQYFSSYWPQVVKKVELQCQGGQLCSDHVADTELILKSVLSSRNLECLVLKTSAPETFQILLSFSHVSHSMYCENQRYFQLVELSINLHEFNLTDDYSEIIISVVKNQRILQKLEITGAFYQFASYEHIMMEILAFMSRPFFKSLVLTNVDKASKARKMHTTQKIIGDIIYLELLVKFLTLPAGEDQMLKFSNIQWSGKDAGFWENFGRLPPLHPVSMNRKVLVFDHVDLNAQILTLLQSLPTVLLKRLEFSSCKVQSFPINIKAKELEIKHLKCSSAKSRAPALGSLLKTLLDSAVTKLTFHFGDYVRDIDQSKNLLSLANSISVNALMLSSIEQISFRYVGEDIGYMRTYFEPLLNSFLDLTEVADLVL